MSVIDLPHLIHAAPYRHVTTRYDAAHKAAWVFLSPRHRACFSFEVLEELRRFQHGVEILAREGPEGEERVRYVILASRTPGVFNFGGDLALFARCVKERNAEMLRRYARACIDVLHAHSSGYDLPVTTLSLVQGDALGGGFEAALCSDVLVSERSALMGFPEVLFNLFPGMGAYNLLQRRMGMLPAEHMILSGKTFRADELRDKGLVDILADDGCGEDALYEYIVRQAGKDRSAAAIHQVRRRLAPVRHDQLLEVAEIWVDTALRMGAREMRMMEKLIRAQDRVAAPAAAPASPLAPSGSGAVVPL